MVKAAQQSVAEHVEKKRAAERVWVARNYPKAVGPEGGVLTELLATGRPAGRGAAPAGSGILKVRYRGSELRYAGDVLGRDGPPLDVISFGSGDGGVPGFVDSPQVFTVEPGKTKLNPGLDGVIATMLPGEHRVVIVPAALAYGRAGLYPKEIPGKRRFVISPNAMLIYDVEVLAGE
jgi:hypothetical protein